MHCSWCVLDCGEAQCRDQHVLLHAHRQRYVDAAADRCGAGAYPPGDEVGLDHHRRWNGGDWIVPELLHQCCELVVGIGAGYATHGENVAVKTGNSGRESAPMERLPR